MKNLILLVVLILISSTIFAQIPPHPELVKKIENGEVAVPYALKNLKELKERGVSSEWTSEALMKKNTLSEKEDIHRIYGPEKTPNGDFNAIFLFVEFSDQASKVSISFFDELLFSTTNGNSMWDYYDEVSYGNLSLTTLDYPSSIDWMEAPNSYDYYVDGENGFGNYPANAQGLARDIVAAVDPVIDFSPYDNDGDGFIDALFIVHTGPGAEYSGSDDDIWSHAWSIPGGGYQTDDGVTARRYSMEPEFWTSPGDMTIGVYVHEMGHSVFGLPDVYDTDYSSSGVGDWSLMAGGSWNGNNGNSPAWPDAWNHVQMGYVNPTVVTTDLLNETITAMTDQPDVYKMWKDGAPGKEYFLVQNRQKAGYDSALPADGLLIWHIDETQGGNQNEWYPGNTSNGNFLVALEQADNRFDLEKNVNSGDSRDPFPGLSNNTQFNFLSSPNSNDYNDNSTYVVVENISASSDNMTADLKITPPAVYLQVTSPNGGEFWQGNTDQTIEWASNGIDDISIEISIDAGSNWESVETTYDAATSLYSWTVPNTPSTDCLIRVTDLVDSTNIDVSNSVFTISPASEIQVVTPNGGESYTSGDQVEVTWTSASVSTVKIQYTDDHGSNWKSVAIITPSDGSFDWTIPDVNSVECLVRITDISNGNVLDESDTVFGITSLTSVENENIPLSYSLEQNYPNPFNPSTQIKFGLPFESSVKLKIFNVLGQTVAELVNKTMQTGFHSVEWNAESLSSGIYFYSIEANAVNSSNSFNSVRKMLLVK